MLHFLLPTEYEHILCIQKQNIYHGFRPTDLIRRDNSLMGSNENLALDLNLKFEEIYMVSEYERNAHRHVTKIEREYCPVCISNYREENMKRLNCSHFVCSNCYLRLENQCPTCRSFIDVKSTIEILKAFENSGANYCFE